MKNYIYIRRRNGQRKRLYIDKEDVAYAKKHNVRATLTYPRIHIGGKSVLLHQRIVKGKRKQVVDHINGNMLDCRRKNLRWTNYVENSLNRKGNLGSVPCKSFRVVTRRIYVDKFSHTSYVCALYAKRAVYAKGKGRRDVRRFRSLFVAMCVCDDSVKLQTDIPGMLNFNRDISPEEFYDLFYNDLAPNIRIVYCDNRTGEEKIIEVKRTRKEVRDYYDFYDSRKKGLIFFRKSKDQIRCLKVPNILCVSVRGKWLRLRHA